jgi:UDP-N-acetylmuramoyl-tripeptide--D-alanyl-D-alanine ligase
VIVQEIGSDRIGQIPQVGTYLRPAIAVITAVSPEHMEYFGSIEAVASEQLAAANFSETAIINRDDIDGRYASLLTNANISTYGSDSSAEYYFTVDDFEIEKGYKGTFIAKDWEEPVDATVKLLGEHNIRSAVAAATVGIKLGLNSSEIKKGISKLHAAPGRMNVLHGFENSIIIDDTNSSNPLAASSALKTLYRLSAPQRIAVLGNMNELGENSAIEHQALGRLCDPNILAWVITVGDDAEKYLAPAARARGCQVRSFETSIQAGAFLRSVMESKAIVLFKGSETRIYLEEAIKIILHSTDDEQQLVRQSPSWLARKNAFFYSVQ